jgi:hypothetical protein
MDQRRDLFIGAQVIVFMVIINNATCYDWPRKSGPNSGMSLSHHVLIILGQL